MHAVLYKNAKKISSETREAYALISSSASAKDVQYTAEILPLRGEWNTLNQISFDSLDETVRIGIKRSSPSSIVGIARRFAELQLAESVMQKLSQGDMFVLDGSLQKNYTNEDALISKLRETSLKNAITVVGFSKTNPILTTANSSFAPFLSHKKGKWFYSPVGTSLQGAPFISFARLHEKSAHVFMMDSFQELKPEHYAALAAYAHDPVFLGYPYGLVEADRAARVTQQEAISLQTQLGERLGRDSHNALTSKNAHGILDKISF